MDTGRRDSFCDERRRGKTLRQKDCQVKRSLEISLLGRETEGLNLSGKRTGAGMPLFIFG